MLRPSLTLILDIDESLASEDTKLEIKRNYAYVCTPVIRTHKSEDGGVQNIARMIVSMGTYKYLNSDDAGADENWNEIIEPWIGNMLYKVCSTMSAFNNRQFRIGLPELYFTRLDLEFEGGKLIVGLHADPTSVVKMELKTAVTKARNLYNGGALAGAKRIDIPSTLAYEAQNTSALNKWEEDHPGALQEFEQAKAKVITDIEAAEAAKAAKEAEPKKSREELLEEDRIAKSYENTAVAPTDSSTLPPIEREEEIEIPERFNFDVDYSIWEVTFEDGATKIFDSKSGEFVSAEVAPEAAEAGTEAGAEATPAAATETTPTEAQNETQA